MTVAWPIRLVLLGIGAFISVVLIVVAARFGIERALSFAIVLPAAGAVLLHPVLPLFLLVVFVPLDALANRLFSILPMSPSAALTAATAAALLLRLPMRPRTARVGLDEPPIRWFLMFALAIVVSLIFADNRELADDAFSRLAGMLAVLMLIVLVADEQRHIRVLVLGLVGATLFSGIVVIADTMLGVRLLSSQLAAVTAQWEGMARSAGASDYNPTAAALMTGAGTLLALVLLVEWPRYRLLTLATVLVGTVSVVLSFARSASIAFAVTALLWALGHRRSRYFPLGLFLGLMALAAALPLVPPLYWERMGTLLNFNSDYTLWRRLGYNLIGIDLFLDNLLMGIGPGNFPHHYVDAEFRFVPGRTLFSRDLHNMYLGIATEFGLLGLIPFLAMIGIAFSGLRKAMRTKRGEETRAFSVALFFTLLGYLIGCAFLPSQYHKLTWILIGLAFAQTRLARDAGPARPPLPGDDDASGGDRQ